jgi:hypothetical protein
MNLTVDSGQEDQFMAVVGATAHSQTAAAAGRAKEEATERQAPHQLAPPVGPPIKSLTATTPPQ